MSSKALAMLNRKGASGQPKSASALRRQVSASSARERSSLLSMSGNLPASAKPSGSRSGKVPINQSHFNWPSAYLGRGSECDGSRRTTNRRTGRRRSILIPPPKLAGCWGADPTSSHRICGKAGSPTGERHKLCAKIRQHAHMESAERSQKPLRPSRRSTIA